VLTIKIWALPTDIVHDRRIVLDQLFSPSLQLMNQKLVVFAGAVVAVDKALNDTKVDLSE
jgi:hypothetical protein